MILALRTQNRRPDTPAQSRYSLWRALLLGTVVPNNLRFPVEPKLSKDQGNFSLNLRGLDASAPESLSDSILDQLGDSLNKRWFRGGALRWNICQVQPGTCNILLPADSNRSAISA